jgi:hypothetical protein
MTGVVGGLLDQMQDDPSKVERLLETEQDVGRWGLVLLSEAGDSEAGGRADDLVGTSRPVAVPADDGCQGHGVGQDFRAPRGEFQLEVSPVDPAPFHEREVVDDSGDRKQAPQWRPPALFLREPLSGRHDLLALALEETQKEIPFIS